MIYLTKKQFVMMYKEMIDVTGGSFGLRDEGLLMSAFVAPFNSFAGQDEYPSLEEKAARLGYGLITNHAMIDGNKRIGAHSMLVFLMLNGIRLSYTQQELETIILDVAAGRSSQTDLLHWIIGHEH